MKTRELTNIVLGIITEIAYALSIILSAFLASLILTFKP